MEESPHAVRHPCDLGGLAGYVVKRDNSDGSQHVVFQKSSVQEAANAGCTSE